MSEFLFVEEYLDSTVKLSKTVPLKVQFVLDLKNKKAFTLAEVLITLGIIGVVAAMTIPTLVNNYQKQQYLTGLKKAYTEFNQVLVQMSADHGCSGDLGCTGVFAPGSSSQEIVDELVKYFKVAKNCGASAGCFADWTNDSFDQKGGKTNYGLSAAYYKFMTVDGTSYAFYLSDPPDNCSSSSAGSSNYTGDLKKTCGMIYIDVNGPKRPNALGADTFIFWLANGNGPKLYPLAGKDQSGYENGLGSFCTPGHTLGIYCAARIIDEGWQMNYYGAKDPYAAGIMPDNSTLVAIGNALHNYSALLRGAAKATLAQGYYNDLRERQIKLDA